MKQANQVPGLVALFFLLLSLAVPALVLSQTPNTRPELGVRHSRIATDTGLPVDRSASSAAFPTSNATSILIPLGATWHPVETAMLVQPLRSMEEAAAERINAAAMRDWQRRFEVHLMNSRVVPMPTLYPTHLQRVVEELK